MNANKNLIIQHWQEETALDRFRMIAPLIDDSLDPAKRVRLRREIAENNDLSYKTVKRYDDAFRLGGFEGTISSSFISPHSSSCVSCRNPVLVKISTALSTASPGTYTSIS